MAHAEEKPRLKRVNYFSGQLLSAADLETEQLYFREKLKRHNRLLHGSGVVFGLEVSIGNQKVTVSPGFALDCTGEEIELTEAVHFDLPKGRYAFLMIAYRDIKAEPVPGQGAAQDDTMLPSRIVEGYQLLYEPDDPYTGHKGDTAIWMPCNNAHPLPLAKLVHRWDNWEVDPWFEPPAITR